MALDKAGVGRAAPSLQAGELSVCHCSAWLDRFYKCLQRMFDLSLCEEPVQGHPLSSGLRLCSEGQLLQGQHLQDGAALCTGKTLPAITQ